MAAISVVTRVYLRVYIETRLRGGERAELQEGMVVQVVESEAELYVHEDGLRSICNGVESVALALVICEEVGTKGLSAPKGSTSQASHAYCLRTTHVIQSSINHVYL